MNIESQIEAVEAKIDLMEATWGDLFFGDVVPASVHDYMSELFRERNRLIEQYRQSDQYRQGFSA